MLLAGGGGDTKTVIYNELKKILEWYETKFLKLLFKKISTDIAIDTPKLNWKKK